MDAVVGQRCLSCHKDIGTTRVNRANSLDVLGPATRALIAINVAIHVAAVFSPAASDFFRPLVQSNALVADGRWWTLVTAAFLHGGWVHLGFNMYALYILGPRLEPRLGTGPFLGLYLVSAIGGGLGGYLLASPRFSQVGASGAIFGMVGYMIWLWWPTRNTPRGRSGWRFVAYMVGVGIVLPFIFSGFISWQGHLGGLVAGLVVGATWQVFGLRTRQAMTNSAVLLAIVLLGLVVATVVW